MPDLTRISGSYTADSSDSLVGLKLPVVDGGNHRFLSAKIGKRDTGHHRSAPRVKSHQYVKLKLSRYVV